MKPTQARRRPSQMQVPAKPHSLTRRWPVALLAIFVGSALVLGSSSPVFAQCPGSLTDPFPYFQGGGPCGTGMLHREPADGLGCTVASSANVLNCSIIMGGPSASMTSAYARHCSGSSKPPLCRFNCNCGTVTWGSATELPVELLNFSID